MTLKPPILFFLPILIIFPLITGTTHGCNRACGTNRVVTYPFGFSTGCPIRLNCSSSSSKNAQISIGEFPIQTMKDDLIKIIIQPVCNRSIQTLHQLFGQNYAPTSRNGILLSGCNSSKVTTCNIPSIDVRTQFDSLKCDSISNSSSISCYSEEQNHREFIDYENATRQQCKFLLSAISSELFDTSAASINMSAVSLDVQVLEVGWWLNGNCHCSENANCTRVITPRGRSGFRCRCNKGFEGDGYPAGSGCRKASCNAAKYISGRCGGKTRIAVLIIGGSTAGASLIISVCLLCCLMRRHSYYKARKSTKRCLKEARGISNIPIYPYREIEKATSGFSEKQRLGTGAFGTVYAGKFQNDLWVAIKRIKHRDADSIQQVVNEIKLISCVSHPNLVRLLGCSIERGEQILVYEFMPNGTLCQHLQRERGDGLSWPVRLTIATETAQAIAHLHSAINPPIYHRDIKSSNILLDYNFKSKVADFGLSRLGMTEISHISTAPQGTPGYLDPQYHQNFHLSDKSDVYSFGVVLVEIITALKVVDFSRPPNEVNLAALASDRISKGCLDEIIDPLIIEPRGHSDAGTLASVHKVAELAFRCLAFHRDMRPSMMEVATELEQIRTMTLEDINCTASLDVSRCSSSYNASERMRDDSPAAVQDSWSSEQSSSSPSSNSLLSNVFQ